jgi:hypothetical protein
MFMVAERSIRPGSVRRQQNIAQEVRAIGNSECEEAAGRSRRNAARRAVSFGGEVRVRSWESQSEPRFARVLG